MSKIISLESSNVKRLRAVRITPQGSVVIIGGDNEQGKTSVLDSIAMLFGGKNEVPIKPVRDGEAKAQIIAKLDNGLIVKRTFTAAGGTALIVESADGARYPSPQSMLDALTGKLMFDPLAFTRYDSSKQKAALQMLVGLNLQLIDDKRKTIYQERTAVNKQAAEMRIKAEAMPFSFGLPEVSIDTSAILTELEQAQKHNAGKANLEEAIRNKQSSLNDQKEKTAMLRRRVLDLEEELRKVREMIGPQEAIERSVAAEHDAAIAADFAFKPIDEAPLRKSLAGATETNQHIQENQARAKALAELKAKTDQANELTEQIERIDAEKAEKLAATPFPIEGLGFSEDGVTFNGIPFSQASAAQQLRVSVAMGAALNPKLRVMLVRDGSLLDPKSLTLLTELADKHDLQVFVERVGSGDASAIIIEDGAVQGAEIAPEPEAKSEPEPQTEDTVTF